MTPDKPTQRFLSKADTFRFEVEGLDKQVSQLQLELTQSKDRIAKLEKALRDIKQYCPVGSWFEKTCTKALKL